MAFRKDASSEPDRTAEIVNARIPLSEAIKSAVARSFPLEDQQYVLDVLSKILSEGTREGLVILGYGDRARFDEAVRLDQEDYGNLSFKLYGCWGTPGWITRDEANRRRHELGFPVRPSYGYAEEREANVKRFVGENTAYPIEQVELSSRLQDDLGLTGPDGVRFIEAFAKQFSVDLRGFRPERHFRFPEEAAWHEVIRLIFRRPLPNLEPITVHDLIIAAEKKRFACP